MVYYVKLLVYFLVFQFDYFFAAQEGILVPLTF